MQPAFVTALNSIILHSLLIGLGTQAIMQTLGRATVALKPSWYESTVFRAFVASQNLLWGVVVATLLEDKVGWRYRILIGLIGGAFSMVIYEVALKRFVATAVTAKPSQDTAVGQ